MELIRFLKEKYPRVLSEKYGIETEDALEALMQVAKAKACLAKGGELDLVKASNLLIDDFRSGKLGRMTLELPAQ